MSTAWRRTPRLRDKPNNSMLLPRYCISDTNASITKTDLRTGSLWGRPPDGSGGPFQPFIPQGFSSLPVFQDAYLLGINATFSLVLHTSYTPDFGHCECDNCKGGLIDIKPCIQTYKARLDILGYDRSKTV